MPSDKRSLLKRYTAQSYNWMQRSIERVGVLHTEFEPHHADYAEILLAIAQTVFIAQDLLKSFATKAWGFFPEDPDIWI